MLEHGSNNSLPATYRIALALSTAFLIHTLLLSGVPSIVKDPPVRHRQQLNLELVATKSNSKTPTAYTPESAEKSVSRNPPFEVTPDNSVSQPVEPVLSTSHSKQKTVYSKGSQAPATKQTSDLAKPATPSHPSSSPSTSGARSQVAEKDSSQEPTQITQSPTEQDPYLIKLAMHLATQLETLRIPAIKELTGSSTMELELQLLENGALTRVRVITSTGIEQIDSAAYRAALSASPYPEPPLDQGGESHFEVKLVFAPSRL
ncbi:protein TonB [Marinobacter sp. LV10R510-11A]|uniref:energy transducer TonB family protein n=1 Tax=Marinobacter sp. LV10R510-11A TaxID=1415568 RepID=UPI000BB7A029|nr:energy transducer TonB [Marinobacter sp. LV10R510-11A]SOB76426.1 protein TonB [Marinobacter sp. LV10R510-11A]